MVGLVFLAVVNANLHDRHEFTSCQTALPDMDEEGPLAPAARRSSAGQATIRPQPCDMSLALHPCGSVACSDALEKPPISTSWMTRANEAVGHRRGRPLGSEQHDYQVAFSHYPRPPTDIQDLSANDSSRAERRRTLVAQVRELAGGRRDSCRDVDMEPCRAGLRVADQRSQHYRAEDSRSLHRNPRLYRRQGFLVCSFRLRQPGRDFCKNFRHIRRASRKRVAPGSHKLDLHHTPLNITRLGSPCPYGTAAPESFPVATRAYPSRGGDAKSTDLVISRGMRDG